MSELKPCPFCKCEMQVKTVGRDWYRIEGDHKETCFFELDDNRLMVPQSDDQLAALLKDWNTRATPIPEIIEQVRALQHEKSLMVSDERAAGRYDAIGDVIEILERYR